MPHHITGFMMSDTIILNLNYTLFAGRFVGSMDQESSQQLQMWFSDHFSRPNFLSCL